MSNVLVVVAHPDDEVLGCGGTIAKHVEAKDDVFVLFCSSRDGEIGFDEYRNAQKVLGYHHVGHTDLPDQAFDTVPLSQVSYEIERWNFTSDIIYTHHPGDLNLDHSIIARAVLTAFRPKPGEKRRIILAFETISSTEWTFPSVFQANWFEKLSYEHVAKKCNALKCYKSQIQHWPHPRSVNGIMNTAEQRGQQVGVENAEAFQLLRRGPC